MAKLTIYKASAGSGKTYRLVAEYIKLLVENPQNYRHILAVTFTNKATAEMKDRIIRELYKVAHIADGSMMGVLKTETGKTETIISLHAKQALTFLLHDYDRFSISTIDSFFQGVLRSFARETGLYGSYEVELDQDAVLNEAVDRLMMDIDSDVELRNWLISMSEEQLKQGKDWQIREQVLLLGKEIEKEIFHQYLITHTDLESERGKLAALRQTVFKQRNWFESECKRLGKELLQLVGQHGLELSDFKGGTRSFTNYFTYLSQFNADKIKPTKTVAEACDNEENWYAKTNKEKKELITTAFHDGLNQKLKETLGFIEKHYSTYVTAIEVSRNLHALGVLSVLASKIREIGKEQNTLLLSEGNQLLKAIIGGNDAPFVYEKIGNYYSYFMIDEFQDTSATQWENFRPLVLNSLAENNSNLVVGDVKQSIYRWRNSEWQLLSHQLKEDLKKYMFDEITLGSNWRSSKNVVNFNNFFFSKAPALMQQVFNSQLGGEYPAGSPLSEAQTMISSVFADVQQKYQADNREGFVQIFTACDEDDNEQAILSRMIDDIEKLQEKGFMASDLSILLRTNREGVLVSNALSGRKKSSTKPNIVYDVVSDDSLFLHTSPLVRFVLSMFGFVVHPIDKVMATSAMYIYEKQLLPEITKSGTVPPRIYVQGQQQMFFEPGEEKAAFVAPDIADAYFPFVGKDEFKPLLKRWVSSTPLGLLTELVSVYKLNQVQGEMANLQALKDAIGDFGRKEPETLYNFLEWWERKGKNIKIQTANERNAITMMTIHKSKGLEFPVVLVPFCNWSFEPTGNKQGIIWCSTRNTSFHDFPLLPVRYSSKLADSLFVEYYQFEKIMNLIDNLNLMYVAFTRAAESLFIYIEKGKKADEPKNAGALVQAILEMTDENWAGWNRTDELEVCVGNIEKTKIVPKDDKTLLLNEIDSIGGVKTNFALKKNYTDLWDEKGQSKLDHGKIVHDILSLIITSSDLDQAIRQVVVQGKISEKEAGLYRVEVEEMLRLPEVHNWFNGQFKVLNEMTLLSPGGGLFRPDRIMLGADQIIIVDYKTSQNPQKSHKTQVLNYLGLMRKMQYQQRIKGFVWYIKNGNILDVENNIDWD